MAAVDFNAKLKSVTEVKAKLRHCDKDLRIQAKTHSNPHINKNATPGNSQLWSYDKACERFDERLAYLDSLPDQNKRKDRVICFGLEIPFPKDLREDDYISWTDKVNMILTDNIGDENIVCVYVHTDEIHEYIDARTGEKTMSRGHIHAFTIPEIDGKLNGKVFSARARMRALNNAIQKMTQQNYGIDFMDGTQAKSKDSITTLKQKSERLEALEKQKEEQEVQFQETLSEALEQIQAVAGDVYLEAKQSAEADIKAQEAVLTSQVEQFATMQENALKRQNEAHRAIEEAEGAKNKYISELKRALSMIEQMFKEHPMMPRYEKEQLEKKASNIRAMINTERKNASSAISGYTVNRRDGGSQLSL